MNVSFAGDHANLFVCDTINRSNCQNIRKNPESSIVSSNELIDDTKLFLLGKKTKIERLVDLYLTNGRIDFAGLKERENFYYGLVNLLLYTDINKFNGRKRLLNSIIFAWSSKKLLKQVDLVLSKVKTTTDRNIILQIKKKIEKQVKKQGY